MIKTHNLTFAYPGQPPVLHDINLAIADGTHVAVSGPNGSGKTTLSLLIKGLLVPSSGTVSVDGFCSGDEISRFEIRKHVGLVFQNPDNTIVTTSVESELAFGLENLGVAPEEMNKRIEETLRRFNLVDYRHTNPSHLSGGEKQRLALASVMIMNPTYLILDEPTALLDPPSRRMLFDSIQEIVRKGTTVIHITQFETEAFIADRVVVLDKSGICLDGKPEDVIPRTQVFKSCGFLLKNPPNTVPPSDDAVHENMSSGILTGENGSQTSRQGTIAVSLDKVGFAYDAGTPFEKKALNRVSMTFEKGSSTVILGASGSGKTTLLEIAAGITAPTSGRAYVNGNPIRAMAFQMPEDQLFGHSVESYIEFGPRNLGIVEHELNDAVSEALVAVGLEPDIYRKRDPLSLSGGEKRRVALAGVLAMNPDMLFLDEPTAGLDRHGMEQVIGFLRKYLENCGALVFSTHDFEVAGSLCTYAVVLDHGRIETYGRIEDVFVQSPWLHSFSL
jgi:energy-coupling factor transport system ATP-binding protein